MKDLGTDWQRTAILKLFLTHIMILYSGLYVFASLIWDSQPRSTKSCLLPPIGTCQQLSESDSLWLPEWLIDHSIWRYLCIYNFITPKCSFRLSHITCCHSSFVYTAGISCLEIPIWKVCQKSLCNSEDKEVHTFLKGIRMTGVWTHLLQYFYPAHQPQCDIVIMSCR